YMRTDLGSGHSNLQPPAVVGEGIVFPPIYGTLSPVSDAQIAVLRRRGKSTLRPPTVVTPPAAFVAAPVQTSLAYSVRGRTIAGVRPPRFVGAGIYFAPVSV